MPAHRCEVWVPADLRIEMCVRINKPGRDHVPFGIDFLFAPSRDIADCSDVVTINGEVARIGLSARAINKLSAANHYVVRHA